MTLSTAIDVRRWLLYAVLLVGAAVCWLLLGASSAHAEGPTILPDVTENSSAQAAVQPKQRQQAAEKLVSATVGQADERATAVAGGGSEAARRVAEPAPAAEEPEPVAVAQAAVETAVATADKATETVPTTAPSTVDKAVETVRTTVAATQSKPAVQTVVEKVVEPVVKPVVEPVKPVLKPVGDGVRDALGEQRADLASASEVLPERSHDRVPVQSGSVDTGPVRDAAAVSQPVAGWSFLDAGPSVLSLLAPVEAATTALTDAATASAVAVIAEQAGGPGALADLFGGLELSSVSVAGSAGSPTSLALLWDLAVVISLMLIGLVVARDRRTAPSPASAPGSTPD